MDVRNLGRAPRYADLRHFLADSGYSEAAICRRYELAHAEDFELDRRRRPRPAAPQSAAQILCDVFLAGDSVTHEAITHLLGANAVQLLDDTGLIAPVSTHAIAATVALYPVDNLYIASDRWNCADERTFVAADDLVYFSATYPPVPAVFSTSAQGPGRRRCWRPNAARRRRGQPISRPAPPPLPTSIAS
jgi:hypothetical protein